MNPENFGSSAEIDKVNKLMFEVTRDARRANEPVPSAAIGNAESGPPPDGDSKKQIVNVQMIASQKSEEGLVLPPSDKPSTSSGTTEPKMSADSSDITGLPDSKRQPSQPGGRAFKGQ